MATRQVGIRLLDKLCSTDFRRYELGICRLLKYSHIKARLANNVEVQAGRAKRAVVVGHTKH